MTFDEYQKRAFETALPSAKSLEYMALGLANEAGEVAGKVKKILRGDDVAEAEVLKELGDVQWYCAGLATILNASLGSVAYKNLEKLQDRKQRGVIQGDGDSR